MPQPSPFDASSLAARPPISDPIRAAIKDAFAIVPPDRSGAIIAIADEHGARIHIAQKIGNAWQVGGQIGVPVHGSVSGQVFVTGSW